MLQYTQPEQEVDLIAATLSTLKLEPQFDR